MAGTKLGGQKAAITNKKLHGADFYTRIGHIGGHNSHNGGFASMSIGRDGLTGAERARMAGLKTKRGAAKKQDAEQ